MSSNKIVVGGGTAFVIFGGVQGRVTLYLVPSNSYLAGWSLLFGKCFSLERDGREGRKRYVFTMYQK